MNTIVFDVLIKAVEQNPYVGLYLYKKMTERFSGVMWTVQQILFMGAARRVARFLWEEAEHTGS